MSRAGEHEEARSAARQEFTEASRGQGEPERADIPRQREPEMPAPIAETGERPYPQPTVDVDQRPDRVEHAAQSHADAEPPAVDQIQDARADVDDVPHDDRPRVAENAAGANLPDSLPLADRDSEADDIVRGADTEPLGEGDRQAFADYHQNLVQEGRTREVNAAGPEYDYQRQWCGDVEYRITPDEILPRSTWADGLNDEFGMAQDAKYVSDDSRSWFIPESMPPAMQGLAEEVMDKRLIKYRDVVNDSSNPIRGLEIIVNDPAAAQAIATRMDALHIPGIVRIRP